jgi:acyl carrier protein
MHTEEATRRLATIWGEVLEIDEVQPGDDFFDLGGDSYTALLAANRISTDFGMKLTLADLIQHITLADLAGFVAIRLGASERRQNEREGNRVGG